MIILLIYVTVLLIIILESLINFFKDINNYNIILFTYILINFLLKILNIKFNKHLNINIYLN